jgi:hypothetical protein
MFLCLKKYIYKKVLKHWPQIWIPPSRPWLSFRQPVYFSPSADIQASRELMVVKVFSIPIGWNRNVKKRYLSKSRPKITFLNRTTGQRNLIGWFVPPPLKSYWLKPQCQKTLLVEIPTKNNLRLPFGQHLCSFDPADRQADNLCLQDSSLRERE